MYTLSTFRIGSRASVANNRAASSESSILRSLFDLRKTYNCPTQQEQKHDDDNDNNNDNDNGVIDLTFRNCSWSPRILQSLRKILVRDGRRFASIKFFDCVIQNDASSSELFAEILEMIMANNSTTSLVIKGGRLIGNNAQQQQQQLSCESSLTSSCSNASILTALREGLSTNASLKSLKLSGLDFSTMNATTTNNGNGDGDDNDSDRGCFQGLTDNTTLRCLDLSGSDLSSSPSTVKGLSDALSQNSTLESLNLRKSSLDDRSLAQLLQSVNKHPVLTTLNLSKNYLGARKSNTASSSTIALDTVAELLRSKSSKLQCLDLSHQYQQHPMKATTPQTPTTEDDDKDNAQLHMQQHAAFGRALGALSTNTSLRRIDLSGNFGCFADPSSLKALAACLAANTGLEHANVSGCGMTPKNIVYLAKECLPVCGTSLKSLVLFGADRGTDTTVPATALDDCHSTQHPRPDHCCHDACHGDAAAALEMGLRSNVTLENLGDLPNDNDGEDITRRTYGRIRQTLNRNKGGRRAVRQRKDSDLPLAAWSHLLARAGNLDYSYDCDSNPAASVVFALLRQGPTLLEH